MVDQVGEGAPEFGKHLPRSTGQLIIKTLASTLRRSIYEQMVLVAYLGTKCPRLHLIQIYLAGEMCSNVCPAEAPANFQAKRLHYLR